jgi:hypothetical protein
VAEDPLPEGFGLGRFSATKNFSKQSAKLLTKKLKNQASEKDVPIMRVENLSSLNEKEAR